MAIDKGTISLNLAKGVNTKSDNKIGGPDEFASLQNARFDKESRISKREGLTSQGTTSQGDPGFINAVAIGTCAIPTKVFAHENQLCMVNNGNLFSQYETQNKWIFKGTCVPLQITNKKIDSSVTFRDVASVSGITIAVGGQSIYVIEEATGNILTKTTLSGSETTLKTAAFSNAAWVFTHSGTGTILYARQVSLTTGSVGTATTVKTDCNGTISVGQRSFTNFALTKTSTASTIGEAVFVAYSGTGGNTFFPFTASGTIHGLGSGTGAALLSMLFPFSVYIEPTSNPNKIYFADTGNVKAFTFSTASYSAVYAASYTATTSLYSIVNGSVATDTAYNNITMALSPINNSDLYLYIDTIGISTGTYGVGNTGTSDDDIVGMISVNSGGTVTGNSIYGRGYRIASNSIRDSVRKTIYLPVTYISPLQSTVLLVDTLEGNGTLGLFPTTYVVGKTLYSYAATASPGFLPSSDAVGTTSTYRVTNNGYFVDFNFNPSFAPASQYFAKTSHITGGLLWAYDGDIISEHNFLISPEQVYVSGFNPSQAVAISVVNQGAGGQQEITNFTFKAGPAFQSGANSISFTSISGTARNTYTVVLAYNGTFAGISGTGAGGAGTAAICK